MELIEPVELQLMDGRSLKLRLSHGAMIRFSRATGLELNALQAGSAADKLEGMARLLYECSNIRTEITYDEFLDELHPVDAAAASSRLFERFAGVPKAGAMSPSPQSPSTGWSDGPWGEVSLGSPTPNSGESAPENSMLSGTDSATAN